MRRLLRRLRHTKPEPQPEGMWMYVEFPDGTTRRCWATFHPQWGFPVTPGFNSPAWEEVEEVEES